MNCCVVHNDADHVNVTKLKACEVPLLPRHDPYWSHSPYCPNWNYVKDFTLDLTTKRNIYLTFAGAVFMPIGAGFADKQGRKPVLFFNFLMGMKSLFINLLSSTGARRCRPPLCGTHQRPLASSLLRLTTVEPVHHTHMLWAHTECRVVLLPAAWFAADSSAGAGR